MFLMTIITFTLSSFTIDEALKITKIDVPRMVALGSNVDLDCAFELNGSQLYSVKWYKGDSEFYRFVPRDTPPTWTFPTEGIKVDLTKSNVGLVHIRNVRYSTEGLYKCEISGETPYFPREFRTKEMEVYVSPKHSPIISRTGSSYGIGDYVRANCSSAKTKPKVVLSWFINNKPAGGRQADKNISFGDGIFRASSTLEFRIEPEVIESGMILIHCRSTLDQNLKNIPERVGKRFDQMTADTIVDDSWSGTPYTWSSSDRRNGAFTTSPMIRGVLFLLVWQSFFLSTFVTSYVT